VGSGWLLSGFELLELQWLHESDRAVWQDGDVWNMAFRIDYGVNQRMDDEVGLQASTVVSVLSPVSRVGSYPVDLCLRKAGPESINLL